MKSNITDSIVWGGNLEYGSSKEEENELNGDQVSEKHVRSHEYIDWGMRKREGEQGL